MRPPGTTRTYTLFPYTTLFRAPAALRARRAAEVRGAEERAGAQEAGGMGGVARKALTIQAGPRRLTAWPAPTARRVAMHIIATPRRGLQHGFPGPPAAPQETRDRKSTRLNSSH